MPNPGFYDLPGAIQDGSAPRGWRWCGSSRAARPRAARQPADLIAVDTSATAPRPAPRTPAVWRTDLLDGLLGALVKDGSRPAARIRCSTPSTRCCAAARAAGWRTCAARPPFLHDLERALAESPSWSPSRGRGWSRSTSRPELDPARLLHRIDVLGLPGFDALELRRPTRRASAGGCAEDPRLDGAVIEGGPPTARPSPRPRPGRLLERVARVERDARAAAAVLVDAALPPASTRSPGRCCRARARCWGRMATSPRWSPPALPVSMFAVGHPRPARAGDRGRRELLGLLAVATMTARCGCSGAVPAEDAGIRSGRAGGRGLRALRARAGARRRRTSRACSRGCATMTTPLRGSAGPAWARCGCSTWPTTTRWSPVPVQFADPEHLGDFLYGLFTLAREPVQRRRDLIERIDAVVMAFADGRVPRGAARSAARVQRVHAAREGPAARSLPGGARRRRVDGDGRAGDARGDARAGSSPARRRWRATGSGMALERRARWRLVLGGDAEARAGAAGTAAHGPRARLPLRPRGGGGAQRPRRDARRLAADRAGLDQRRARAVPAAGRRAARAATRWSATGCSRSSPARRCSSARTPNMTLLKAVLRDQAPDERPRSWVRRGGSSGPSSTSCSRSSRASPLAVHRRAGPAPAEPPPDRGQLRRAGHDPAQPAPLRRGGRRIVISRAAVLLARAPAHRSLAGDRARRPVGLDGRLGHPRGGHRLDLPLAGHAAARPTSPSSTPTSSI